MNNLVLGLIVKASTSGASGPLQGLITDLKNVDNASRTTGDTTTSFASKLGAVGGKAQQVGGTLTRGVTMPIAGIATAAAKTAMDFDAKMSQVQAISGATGGDLEKLRDKAKEMGAKTKFSASESADAFKYMAMAGWKTGDMLNGISGIMDLAAASGEDLGTTSDIVTDALTAFGLKAQDSGHFADVLAAASSNANTNVAMMGETFKYAAPMASTLGFSVEDTATVIGLMANSGIKASMAGTTLRKGFQQLSKDSGKSAQTLKKYGIEVKNSDGSMKSLREIVVQLRDKLGGLSDTEKAAALNSIFGTTAMAGWAAVVNSSDSDFQKLTGAIDDCDGKSKEMADTMMGNAQGGLIKMKSALEGCAIAIGENFGPWIAKAADWVTNLAEKFSKLDKEDQEFIIKMGLIAAAAGPVISVLGKMASSLSSTIFLFSGGARGLGSLAGAAGGATSAIGGVSSAAGGATGAVGGLIGSAGAAAGAFLILAGVAGGVAIAIKQTRDEWNKYTDASDKMLDTHQKERDSIDDTITNLQKERDELSMLISKQHKTKEDKERIVELVDDLNEKIPDLNANYDENADALNITNGELDESIKKREDELKAAQNSKEIDEITKQRTKVEKDYNKLLERREDLQAKIADWEERGGDRTSVFYQNWKRELKTTEKQIKNCKDSYGDLTTQIEADNDRIKDANAITKNTWRELELSAKNSGVMIPKELKKGIDSGIYEIPGSIGELQALMDPQYANLAKMAAENGLAIPQYLKEGLADGSVDVTEATQYLFNELDKSFDERAEEFKKKSYADGGKAAQDYAQALAQNRGVVEGAFEYTMVDTQDAALQQAVKNAAINGIKIPDEFAYQLRTYATNPQMAARMINDLVSSELAKRGNARKEGINLCTDYSRGITDHTDLADRAIKILQDRVYINLKDKGKAAQIGNNFVVNFSEGIRGKVPMPESVAQIMSSKVMKQIDKAKDSEGYGRHISEGLAKGISDGQKLAIDAAATMANRALGAIGLPFRISSPSKVMIQYGKYIAQGLAIGMASNSSLGTVSKAASKLSTTALNNLEGNYSPTTTGGNLSAVHNPHQAISTTAVGTVTSTGDGLSDAILALAPYLAEGVNKGIDNLTMEIDGRQFGRMVNRYA